MRNELSKYSDDELLEELVRRKNKREQQRPVKWCHDCKRFWPTKDEEGNPCSMGHKMSFRVPHDYTDLEDNWGHYRRVCSDRLDV